MVGEKKFDIAVVGSCNIDLISYVERLPRAGETLCGSKFSMGCGGKGANQCVMAAKLGANTAMIGCVGDDTFGEMYLKNFTQLGVDTSHVRVAAGVSTGVAPISVNSDGENSIIIVKGANDLLTTSDVQSAMDIIRNSSVLICQLEITYDVTLAALKAARDNSVTTIFNPAPAVSGLSKEFLQATDILCVNETEAEILTGLPVTSIEECNEAAKKLLQSGPRYVIVTLGARGALLGVKGENEINHIQSSPEDVQCAVDTTGAGDSFVGTLAYFVARHPEIPMATMVQRSVKVASMSVRKEGTQTSYPMRDEVPHELFV